MLPRDSVSSQPITAASVRTPGKSRASSRTLLVRSPTSPACKRRARNLQQPSRHRRRTGWAVAGHNQFPAFPVAACGPRSSGRAAGWRRATRRRPRPCEPRTAPPPPAHSEVPREHRVRAARPRGAVPPPPQPGGHPHGVLPPLDGHGRAPQMGAVSPTARSPSDPALHEALSWRYGVAAPLWRPPRLHWRKGAQPFLVVPLLVPLWDLGPLPSAGCPWSRGGTTRRRAPEAIGWLSPTTAP